MIFETEKKFEDALTSTLQQGSWKTVINHPTEEDLWENLRSIINNHNKGETELNGCPLTDFEFQQIKNKISSIGNDPCTANEVLKGETISVRRDNENDKLHFGQDVHLNLYSVDAIAGGDSIYQIVRQPKFNVSEDVFPQRRGDVELLINGLPLVHIELKNHNIPIAKAFNQMKKYAYENAFSGIWSMLQVMVAMNPEEAKYFANPGSYENYSDKNMFYWEDSENELIKDWDKVANTFLSIPLIQTLIGYYTSVDKAEKNLLIFRSYQYWAADSIIEKIKTIDWNCTNNLGGYVWHTMSSGKTLTSLKTSELILRRKVADKVCFLTPRNELGTQTFGEYTNFAENEDDIISVESTDALIGKLKNDDEIIITPSIQKMGMILERVKENDKKVIDKKRLVIMVDECHFSVYGDLMYNIKKMFPHAVFFGFTGTPITNENHDIIAKTSDVFGSELCRYTISDAMRDNNILKFDPEQVFTYKDSDLKESVAKDVCKVSSEEEALADENKKMKWLDVFSLEMPIIESKMPTSIYKRSEHREAVVEEIKKVYNRKTLLKKYHSLFATSSINEAILYWNLIRKEMPDLKVAAVFDSNDDNGDDGIFKLETMKEMLKYYKETFNKSYNLSKSGYDLYRKDIADRIRHKHAYTYIEEKDYIDMIIVVNQMLEGFDSHFINTLFVDKVLDEEHLLQAFSRTIRKAGPDKTQGNIMYFRRPHTMKNNIHVALGMYAGTNEREMFTDNRYMNLTQMNAYYDIIKTIFENDEIENFSELPKTEGGIKEFVNSFNNLYKKYTSARIQGFSWDELTYNCPEGTVTLIFDKHIFDTLSQRYKDVSYVTERMTQFITDDTPYDLDSYLIEGIEEIIDADYLNERFVKWKKAFDEHDAELMQRAMDELRTSFVQLSKEDKGYAESFIHDVEFGNIQPEDGKTLRDYILEYKVSSKNKNILLFAKTFGINCDDLIEIINSNPKTIREANLNRRLDNIKTQVDIEKAVTYYSNKENEDISMFEARIKFNDLITDFILKGGYEI